MTYQWYRISTWLIAVNFNLHYFTEVVFIRFLQIHCVSDSHSIMSDSLQPHGLKADTLLCPWSSPGRNTRVGCHFFLQGIFSTQRWNLVSCTAGSFFTFWAIREAPWARSINIKYMEFFFIRDLSLLLCLFIYLSHYDSRCLFHYLGYNLISCNFVVNTVPVLAIESSLCWLLSQLSLWSTPICVCVCVCVSTFLICGCSRLILHHSYFQVILESVIYQRNLALFKWRIILEHTASGDHCHQIVLALDDLS